MKNRRVVDEHVEPPPPFFHVCDCGRPISLAGDIAVPVCRTRPEFSRDGGASFVEHIDAQHTRAFAYEAVKDRFACSSRAAGNDRNSIVQTSHNISRTSEARMRPAETLAAH